MISVAIPKLEGKLEERLATLLARVARYAPTADRDVLQRAYAFAAQIHDGQFRRSGDPYITHPLEVAYVLAEMEMDIASIAAGLLHDTIEDGKLARETGEITPVTREDITQRFGAEVGTLVEGVTKLGTLQFSSHEVRQAENLRKMLLATARDVRVILIKLADRFHNMRTLKYMPETDQRRIADETLRIFAPIAHRLGVWKLKWELEDQSLRALKPDAYREIQNKVNRTRAEREEVISLAITQLEDRLRQLGIDAEVLGRPKHFYSIYNKMKTQDVDFGQILDLEAIRVVVNTVQACYAALGEVHSLWLPLPNMFTDYIAKPKPNMYQSLHTKVIGPHGQPLEVQIRTWEMHRTAEFGIAAHWQYKEGEQSAGDEFDKKVSWVRGLLDMQADSKNEVDWLESLKVDLFKDQVFVFTPTGDIIDLPAGSTPIDFAYRIHTDVGARCAGAKVNGRMVPLTYKFANGDVVAIIVKANQKPSLDWLNIAASGHARSKIKAYFRKANREENIARGREALEEACRREGIALSDLKVEKLNALAAKLNLSAIDEIYAQIGYGELTPEGVLHRLREELPKRSLDELRTIASVNLEQKQLPVQITDNGIDGVLFRLSRCCQPIPGDTIVGFVTRGKGVTIHRVDCPNLQKLREEPDDARRLINLDWQDTGKGVYQAQIEIIALNRVGLAADIYAIFSETKTNVRSSKMSSDDKHRMAHIHLAVDTTGVQHLQDIISRINRLNDVIQIHRRRTTNG